MSLERIIRILLLVLSLSATTWLLADDDEDEEEWEHGRRGARGLAPVANTKWKEECSSCHMLYHPGLLPARSWQAVMKGLDKHFGENASVDAATREELLTFLTANSADRADSRRSAKIARAIPAQSAPLRITETPSWRGWHDELKPSVFKREKVKSPANCAACHPGAERGDFSEHSVKIPR